MENNFFFPLNFTNQSFLKDFKNPSKKNDGLIRLKTLSLDEAQVIMTSSKWTR